MSVPRVIVNTQQTNIEGSNMTAAQSALSSVKKFQNSRSGDALSFIKLFERAMGIMKVKDDAMKIHWLGTRLTAVAFDWFSDYYESNDSDVWEHCKAEFLSTFKRKVDRSVDILIQLAQIRQATWEGETVESYGIRIRRRFNDYDKQPEVVKLSEKQKVSYFVRGLNPDLTEFVKTKFATRDGYSDDVRYSEVLEHSQFVEENARQSHESAAMNMEKEEQLEDEIDKVHIGAIKVNSGGNSRGQNEHFKAPVSGSSDSGSARKGRTLAQVDKDVSDIKNSLEAFKSEQRAHNDRMQDYVSVFNTAVRNMTENYKQLESKLDYLRPNGLNSNSSHDSNQKEESDRQQQPPWPSKPRRFSPPPICYSCGVKGHISPHCPASEMEKQAYKKRMASWQEPRAGFGGANLISDGPHAERQGNFRNGTSVTVGPTDGKTDFAPVKIQSNLNSKSMIHPDRVNNIRVDNSEAEPEVNNVNVQVINKTGCLTNDHSSNLLTAEGEAFGVKMNAILIDTGAAISCLSFDVFNKFSREDKEKLKAIGPNKELTTATGEPMSVVGEIDLEVILNGLAGPIRLPVKCAVVKRLNSECLLGANIFDKDELEEYTVDLKNRTLKLVKSNDKSVLSICLNKSENSDWNKVTGRYAVYSVKDIIIPSMSSVNIHSQAQSTELPMTGEFIFEPAFIGDIPIEIELYSSIFKTSNGISNRYVPFMIENSKSVSFSAEERTIGWFL